MTTQRFGEFELDHENHRLLKRGRPVAIQELPLRLLALLVARAGDLVSRDELFQYFWPDDSSGILDDNLNTLVRKLRQALNDSARSSRFVETVPKQGYRFIAPVISEEIAPAAPEVARPVVPGRWKYIAAAAFVLVAAVSALYLSVQSISDRGETRRNFGSVAVMPFVNASENNQRDYFGDGLADDILNRLSGFPGLRVVSRTSSFALRETALDARSIGERLKSDALVEGSVRRDGEQLRINVRLIDTENGYQLWARSYQRELTDIFAVQEEIALEIASALAGELQDGEEITHVRIDPAAYDNYLKGRFFWHKRSNHDLSAAVQFFEDAIGLAPDYAPAWAGLADAFAVLGFYDYMAPSEAFTRAKGAARRALQLDPRNASAEANLGYVALYYDWDFEEAEARFLQAIAINPDSSKAHQWYANLLVAAGRFDEAEREMRRATELDPLSLIANAALGWVLYHAGAHESALNQLALAQELNPDFELVYLWRGWTMEMQGDYPGAVASLRENVARSGGSGIGIAALARALALKGEQGDREEARGLLADLQASGEYQPSYEIARAYLALDELALAGEWLERALEQRSHSMVFLDVDPQMAAFRESPAYPALAARVFSER
ncbi:winged helix-turn-helix domain-containing tetratricopeptide repeat protein [Microbulbifer aggregans]|uniref:winged helix-turn-helix domain-containing tetratricopeptide repeat protein n=1 Tax=Microbulbifer aggregans TaxID=1769779 RepID=UPI001CFD3C5A|nr:tetratricopeptide repeat protein [Microbulbifer aggregans]